MTRLAFPTDEHFPFQDEHARSVALQIVRDFGPDIRIAGSDGLDFYTLSRFDKDPNRINNLQWEINEWKRGQREWHDAAPEAGAFYLIGNHEERLKRYLFRHPELYYLEALQLPTLLGMAELGIFWEKSKGDEANLELVIHNKLVVKHGAVVRKNSAYSARGELEAEKHSISVMTGHTHQRRYDLLDHPLRSGTGDRKFLPVRPASRLRQKTLTGSKGSCWPK